MARSGRNDHVARLIEQRRAVSPDVALGGMEILARARRLTLLSRAPIEAVFARHGLDAGEFDVLATLRRSARPSLRPTELYQELMVSSGGMTDRLHRLEQAGLIARIDCDEDRRSRRVQLTAQGMAVIDRAFAEDMAVEHALLSALDDQQQDQLADLLAQLLTAIERTQAQTQP